MDIKTFLISFEKHLISSGISPQKSRALTLNLGNNLTPAECNKIESIVSDEQVKLIASGYISNIISKDNANAKDKADTYTDRNSEAYEQKDDSASGASTSEDVRIHRVDDADEYRSYDEEELYDGEFDDEFTFDENGEFEDEDDDIVQYIPKKRTVQVQQRVNFAPDMGGTTKTIQRVKTTGNTNTRITPVSSDIARTRKIDKVSRKDHKVRLTPEGKKEYSKLVLKTLPMAIPCFIVILVLVLAIYALIASTIVFFVATLCAITVLGSAATLAGLIYGLIQLFTIVPEGLFEIGLAIGILGVTLALSILSYNLALRYVPMLWRAFSVWLKEKTSYIKRLKNEAKVRCNSK